MIKEKTAEEIVKHKAKVLALYTSTGKDLYKKIADACQDELDSRAMGGQKKTEEPRPMPQPKPVQAERKQYPQPEPKPEKEADRDQQIERENKAAFFEERRQGKTAALKPAPKAPAKVHREFLPGLYIEEPATLGELEVSAGDQASAATLDIPMVNGTILTATYGIAKARARYYFNCVMATDDFKEKRYTAVLKLRLFKNLIRLVRGWGVLKSLDKNNPDYPTLTDIFKVQRQTREDRVNQANILFQMVMERVDQKE